MSAGWAPVRGAARNKSAGSLSMLSEKTGERRPATAGSTAEPSFLAADQVPGGVQIFERAFARSASSPAPPPAGGGPAAG